MNLLDNFYDYVNDISFWNVRKSNLNLNRCISQSIRSYEGGYTGGSKKSNLCYIRLNDYVSKLYLSPNDLVDATFIQNLIERRRYYKVPFIQINYDGLNSNDLMARIELTAKELGLEAFQDQSQQNDIVVNTITIAGSILVIDIDLSSNNGVSRPQPSLTRLKTTYATNSNVSLDQIDNLLSADLDKFVTPRNDPKSTKSIELQSELSFLKFRDSLYQLVSLDKFSQLIGESNDLFVNFDNILKIFNDISNKENELMDEGNTLLHLYPSLTLPGHGLTLNHSPRPYLTQLIHVSTKKLSNIENIMDALSFDDSLALHIEILEQPWPLKQAFPIKTYPSFLLTQPLMDDIQVIPQNDKPLTAFAFLSRPIYLPKNACLTIQAALGFSDPLLENNDITLTWTDFILQKYLKNPTDKVNQKLPNSQKQTYTIISSYDHQPAIKVTSIPFKSALELMRIIEILKAYLFIEDLFSSCLIDIDDYSKDQSNYSTIGIQSDPLALKLTVNTTKGLVEITLSVVHNTLNVQSQFLNEELRQSFKQVIEKSKNIPISLAWLISKIDNVMTID